MFVEIVKIFVSKAQMALPYMSSYINFLITKKYIALRFDTPATQSEF